MISLLMNQDTMPGGGPLVVKLGGAAVEDSAGCDALWDALASLHRSEPMGIVLVHGGGASVDRRLARLGLTTQRRDGIRITPPDALEEVVASLAGVVNTDIIGRMQSRGIPAVGLTLSDGFMGRCAVSTKYKFDPGRVGEINGGAARLPMLLLRSGFIPVISSIGLDDAGKPLNINADEAAAAIAGLLEA
ncbi:MAG: acetylglutamate kinase, partial [Planctomycetota bacterium]|nr:acetylglutamate kinase [Planctomycetota bacterium]